MPYAFLAALISVIVILYIVVRPMMMGGESDFRAPRLALSLLILLACFFSVFVFWFIARPDRRYTASDVVK
jgi:hypothetical protein